MSSGDPSSDQRRAETLDRYLDGQLEGEELAAFERELEASPELRAEVERQRRLDAALERRLSPPEIPMPDADAGARAPEGETGGSAPAGRAGQSRPHMARNAVALAALLAIAAVGGYYFFFAPQKAPFDQPHEVYTRLVEAGFEPATVCETDEQFVEWMRDKHEQPMLIPVATPGVELVGWHYKRVLTTRTSVLLARVSGEDGDGGARAPDADAGPGQEVLVLIEDRGEARRLRAPAGSRLNVFRRNIGGVALYEVTPLEEPRLLPHARVPE